MISADVPRARGASRELGKQRFDRRRRAVRVDRADQLHVDRLAATSLATQPCDDLGDRMGSSIGACRIR